METNVIVFTIAFAIAAFIGGMIGFRIIFPMMVARGTPKRRPPEFYRSIASATPTPDQTGEKPVDNAPKYLTDHDLTMNMSRPFEEISAAVPSATREHILRNNVRPGGACQMTPGGKWVIDLMDWHYHGIYYKVYDTAEEVENDPVLIYYKVFSIALEQKRAHDLNEIEAKGRAVYESTTKGAA